VVKNGDIEKSSSSGSKGWV